MKQWQKAVILLVVTPLLALAARFVMASVFVWHFFFVAKCNPASGCEDDGAWLYTSVFWIGVAIFTAYFFFAFVWFFGGRRVNNAARD